VGHEDKPLFVLQIFSPPCGLNMLFSLEGPNFQVMLQAMTIPQLPTLHQHQKLRTQKSKMLLRISVTTANPTTSKCTQIATKPCKFNQII